jgi:hypothetical protein
MQSIQREVLSPYVGPRPFGPSGEDRERFFGRNDETQEIVTLILNHQLVLIYAQSGTGKTSILNAAVTPELEKNGFEVLPLTRVGFSARSATDVDKSLYYDNDLNFYIFNTLCSLKPNIDPKLLANKSLLTFLNDYFPPKLSDNKPSPQVIIFDQFEELFNLFPERWHEQQEIFFKQVAQVLDKNHLLRIVFVIREDYVGQLLPFAWILPEKLRPRFRLERLRKGAALSAIKGPLENIRFHFDEDQAENIVDDLLKMRIETITGEIREVEGEFVEPIQLQVVCQRLWHKRLSLSNSSSPLSNTLSPHDMELLGDVDAALSDFYVNTIDEAAKQCRIYEGDLRRWFEEKLITPSGTRAIVHRDTESTGGMPNQVVDILENMHIVRKEWRSGSPWFELTHDRLIQPIKNSNRLWRQDNRWEIWLHANIGMKKTRNAVSKRPIGITILTCISVIIGVSLIGSATLSLAGSIATLHLVFGYISLAFGVTYIALAISFWRADVWAFNLYNYVNYGLILTTLVQGTLLASELHLSVSFNQIVHHYHYNSTETAATETAAILQRYIYSRQFYNLIGQIISIVWTFVVARYLNNKHVKSYFYQNATDARLSQL